MGLLRDAIGSALGGDSVNNGLGGSKLPFMNNNNSNNYTSSSSWQSRPMSMNQRDPSPMRYENSVQFQQEYQSRPHSPYSPEAMRRYASNQGSLSHQSYGDSPPPYNPRDRTELTEYNQRNNYVYRSDGSFQGQTYNGVGQVRDSRPSSNRGFRPLALPQIDYGDGQPFLRGYSDELRQYGISERDFIQMLDAINVAIIPNAEAQIFQKGANIAGWFLPGAASIGLMAGQVGVGIGTAVGHSSAIARVLSKANLELFLPNGLEICICKSKDVDAAVGVSSFSGRRPMSSDMSPEGRIASYGGSLAPLSIRLPPAQNSGRNDPIAMLGHGIANRSNQKKAKKAQEDMAEGKTKKWDSLEGGLKWLMVRQATPDAIEHWQRTLQQGDAAQHQGRTEMAAQNHPLR